MPRFNIVLHTPEIPGNTGNIGRTCLALDLRLILIHPLGFELTEKALRRAGLDYWKFVSVVEYKDYQDFLSAEKPKPEKIFFFSKRGTKVYFDTKFSENDYLIFGSETQGLPMQVMENQKGDFTERTFRLPIVPQGHVRSLNLSSAVCAVAYEAIRQMDHSSLQPS